MSLVMLESLTSKREANSSRNQTDWLSKGINLGLKFLCAMGEAGVGLG